MRDSDRIEKLHSVHPSISKRDLRNLLNAYWLCVDKSEVKNRWEFYDQLTEYLVSISTEEVISLWGELQPSLEQLSYGTSGTQDPSEYERGHFSIDSFSRSFSKFELATYLVVALACLAAIVLILI